MRTRAGAPARIPAFADPAFDVLLSERLLCTEEVVPPAAHPQIADVGRAAARSGSGPVARSSLAVHIPTGGVEVNGLAYVAEGAGPHPTLVLLHGLPGNEKNLDLAHAVRRAGWMFRFGCEGSFESMSKQRLGPRMDRQSFPACRTSLAACLGFTFACRERMPA